jgi:translation initiation factor 2 subunit 2
MEDMDLSRKKKRTSAKPLDSEKSNESPNISFDPDPNCDEPYSYKCLLNRLYTSLGNNSQYIKNQIDTQKNKGKINIIRPKINPEGSKKTVILNFQTICTNINREEKSLSTFISNELATTISIGGVVKGSKNNERTLIIRGRFKPAAIETIIKQYIIAYVRCPQCKSINTYCIKENRIERLNCNNCTASTAVQRQINIIK